MKPRLVPSVLAAVSLLAGCATASVPHSQGLAPAACTDSLYVQLARQHPDSLSERAWRRFQTLDSACARARAQTATSTNGRGMMGMGHGQNGSWTILVPLVVVGMAVMMVAFWF